MIVPVEASLSGSKCGLLVELLDFAIEDLEGGTERAWERVGLWEKCRPVRAQNAHVEFGVEERDLEAVAGRRIAVRARDAMNQPLKPQTPEVVGHLRRGIGASPERFHMRADIAIAKAVGQMGKAGEGLQERHHARIAEAER